MGDEQLYWIVDRTYFLDDLSSIDMSAYGPHDIGTATELVAEFKMDPRYSPSDYFLVPSDRFGIGLTCLQNCRLPNWWPPLEAISQETNSEGV